MFLAIDIGNTRIKAAVFKQKDLIRTFVFDSFPDFLQSTLCGDYAIKQSIVCSVANIAEAQLQQLSQKMPVTIFTAQTPVPIKNLYKTSATLGSDRLAAAIGANAAFPSQNLLVIDAGTCIKYNFVNNENCYLGGAIAPGLQMRFNALNTFTARLPLLHPDYSFNKLIGESTNESILSGVQTAVIAETDALIDVYKTQFPDLKVLFTGGDVNFFEKRLKNSIFADQNLILKGLNEILIYNKER